MPRLGRTRGSPSEGRLPLGERPRPAYHIDLFKLSLEAMPKSESVPVTTPMCNPAHLGEVIHDLCLDDCGAETASARLGIARDELEPVLASEAPMTASLAIDLEEAGIGNAALWMRIQGTYTLAQERLRRVRES